MIFFENIVDETHNELYPSLSVVYRGCANQENLNFGVDTHIQCAHQGGSLYYFCKGDLCNFGQIGHVCGHKPHHVHYQSKYLYS